jgi:hypothetical protein
VISILIVGELVSERALQLNSTPQAHSWVSPSTVAVIILAVLAALFLMSGHRKNQTLSFLLAVSFLLAIGIVLLLVPIPYLGTTFTHSLGDALIIAAIISLTVDVYLKQRVLQEVSSDVSKYLIGYRLPEPVQDRIRALLQTRWIRRNCSIRLRLVEIPEKPRHVRIEMVVSKDLENITTEENSFQDQYAYEKHLPENVLEMRCDSPDRSAQYRIAGPGLAKEKTDEPGVMQALGSVVKIPPVHEALGKYYRFTVRYEAEYPDNYSDILSFDLPTIGVIFEAECPPEFRVSVGPADVVTPNRWEYRKLFLPGEHIRFRWERHQEGN